MPLYHAIRHIPSGQFFPQFQGPQTHYDLPNACYAKNPPRLFRRGQAKRWLTHYCKGSMILRWEYQQDGFGDERTYQVKEYDRPREIEDYELVPMLLDEVEPKP